MPKADPEPSPAVLRRAPFWHVFTRSRIPMALLDRDRRYVEVNDAVVELYQYPRAEVIGSRSGRTLAGDPSVPDAEWDRLVRTGELYGAGVVVHANGSKMHVRWAAHAAPVRDRWLALVVTLSARLLPGGRELVGSAPVEAKSNPRSALTPREREIVRLLVLGCETREMAAELRVSAETIRTHVRNAMAKTGARTRAQLVAVVLSDGVVE
jgi:DNA-binding CsgD family transcriptional regulator